MGRWGFRLFEGDQDHDIACGLDSALKPINLPFSELINQPNSSPNIAKTRKKIDTEGLADRLLDYCRSKEQGSSDPYGGKYRTIIAGALLMRVGAKIRPEDIQHLREIVPDVGCRYGYALPIFDFGFRQAGKVQFLAALDHCIAGTPRDFHTKSCANCGKIEADKGSPIRDCSGCKQVAYCDKECQRKEWKNHKPHCKTLEERSQGMGFVSLNV